MQFAILGSHPDISIAEINVVTGATPVAAAGIVALFDDLDVNMPVLMQQLGGTQKIGHVIGEVPNADPDTLIEFLTTHLEYGEHERKLHFGISIYDFGDASKVDKLAESARKMGLSVKNALKAHEISARFVMAKEAAISAVGVLKNELITKGAEFVVMVAPDKLVIGTTLGVQDADAWGTRDFGRPRRNAKQGMLPPKLARMMLNMTGKTVNGATVLDPFCGSGTVLMEAALLGAGKLLGGDVSGKATHDTRENTAWLHKELHIDVPPAEFFTSKASEIATHIPPNSVDMLVTETYLGNPRNGGESVADVKEGILYIETMYRESFAGLKSLLKGGSVIVIAAPIHFVGKETVEPDVEGIMTSLGYKNNPIIESPLIYHRADQLVGRHFYRFTV